MLAGHVAQGMWESWKQRVNAVASDMRRRQERCLGKWKNKERVRSWMRDFARGRIWVWDGDDGRRPTTDPFLPYAVCERARGGARCMLIRGLPIAKILDPERMAHPRFRGPSWQQCMVENKSLTS